MRLHSRVGNKRKNCNFLLKLKKFQLLNVVSCIAGILHNMDVGTLILFEKY